jgi:microcystin-dependent protein
MDAYLGEIRIFPYVFAPRSWARCDGQLLSIPQNTALFSILGTYYGGNGSTNFALPDFRDRAPMCWGQGRGLSNYALGQTGGDPAVMLTSDEIAQHQHNLYVSVNNAITKQPLGQLFAVGVGVGFYGPNTGQTTTLATEALGKTGNSVPHNNMQPYLAVQFCICLEGIYPPRSTAEPELAAKSLLEGANTEGLLPVLGTPIEGLPEGVDTAAWEGTVQGEPDAGAGDEGLPPGVLPGQFDPAWEGTKQGFGEEEDPFAGVEPEDVPSE